MLFLSIDGRESFVSDRTRKRWRTNTNGLSCCTILRQRRQRHEQIYVHTDETLIDAICLRGSCLVQAVRWPCIVIVYHVHSNHTLVHAIVKHLSYCRPPGYLQNILSSIHASNWRASPTFHVYRTYDRLVLVYSRLKLGTLLLWLWLLLL